MKLFFSGYCIKQLMSRPVIRGLLPLPDISWNIEASADPKGAQGTNYCDYINRNKKVPN